MADGYEPTSAVSQGAAAGAAMFGAPQPNQALGYAQLQQDKQRMQQQGQLAQQGMQADERRAQEKQQEFQQGSALQREQMAATSKEGADRRAHEQKMEQQRQQFEQQLQQQAFDRQQALKIAELEFAKANAETREKLAPQLMQHRKDVANLNAKLGAAKVLSTQGRERLADFLKQASDMKEAMEKAKVQEGKIGGRSAKSALNRMYEDMVNAGKDGYKTYRDMIGYMGVGKIGAEDTGFDLLNIRPDIVDEAGNILETRIGTRLELAGRAAGQMVSDLTGGSIDTGTDASSIASIDEGKISTRANELISRNIARAISEQTGDKVAPDQIREALDAVFKGGDDVGDQAVLLGKLQQVGVSPEVAKSALLNMANALDGTEEGPLSRTSIKQKMAAVVPGSAQYMALQASLKLVDQMQSKARVAAGQIPGADLDGLNEMINYIQRGVQGGGAIKRGELERLVPTFMGGRQDEDLLDRIRSDTLIGDLEKMGADPFGQLTREQTSIGQQLGDLSQKELDVLQQLEMLKEGGSRELGGLIGTMRGIR